MPALRIRRAERADAPTLLGFIRELAAYEREPQAVRSTVDDLIRDGFGARPRLEALIAEIEGRPAGFVLMYETYSAWEGRCGLYLEDLFVRDWARGRGIGRRLVAEAAAIAVARNCSRLDLNVLDWNPARRFYERLGLHHVSRWLPYRVHGAALHRLAARAGHDAG